LTELCCSAIAVRTNSEQALITDLARLLPQELLSLCLQYHRVNAGKNEEDEEEDDSSDGSVSSDDESDTVYIGEDEDPDVFDGDYYSD